MTWSKFVEASSMNFCIASEDRSADGFGVSGPAGTT